MAGQTAWAAVAAAVSLLSHGGASAHRLRNTAVSAEGAFIYDYAHRGQDWVQATCASRQRQSPINFADLTSPPTGKLTYKYEPVTTSVEVSNNGHTFSADLAGLGYGGITYEQSWYNLMNINVHSKSEHTFQGVHTPVELHLVHKRSDSDALLIVAIPFDSATPPESFLQESGAGPAPAPAPAGSALYSPPSSTESNFNDVLQMFLKVAPPRINQKAVNPVSEMEPLDLNKLFDGGMFFEYAGSLTAPPCSEIVTWFVRRDPVMASDLQVRYLHDAIYGTTVMFGNARDTMPLNGRVIAVRQGVQEEPPPRGPQMDIPLGPNPRTDREYRAMKWAKDALKIAKASTDYVRDLDFRLRTAAQAHQDALTPNLIPELMPTEPPPPEPTKGPTAAEMARTAKKMANVIADAAKSAITQAAEQIAVESRAAAMEAAKEAAKTVGKSLPNPKKIAGAPAAAIPVGF